MKVLVDHFAEVVTKCRGAFARNEQLEEEKKNLKESVLQINETLANVQNENMIMQSERDKLLNEKAQDQATLVIVLLDLELFRFKYIRRYKNYQCVNRKTE